MTMTKQQLLMVKARKLYIELFPLTADRHRVRLERSYIFEWITTANSSYKSKEYNDYYALGVRHSLMGLPVTYPGELTSDMAWKWDKRISGKRSAYLKGYDFAEGWKPLTAIEHAEIEGDGARCSECEVFIPSGGTNDHTESCSIGQNLARSTP